MEGGVGTWKETVTRMKECSRDQRDEAVMTGEAGTQKQRKG